MFNIQQGADSLEKGQGLVEYALILVLVSVVVIAIMSLVGEQIQETFCTITLQLDPNTSTGACVSPIVNCSVESVSAGKIILQAVVTDPDGTGDIDDTINSVVFYEDGGEVQTEYWFEYCLGGGDNCTNNPYNTSSGNHTYSAVATDIDGNTGQCSVKVNIP